MAKLVSKTYGDALFATLADSNSIENYFEAAKVVAEVIRTNEDFDRLIRHPKIKKEDKVKIVEETFKDQIPKKIIGLMVLMITKGRAEDILPTLDYFVSLVKEEKKIGKADVTTAVELSEAQKKDVEKKLLESTKYKTLEMYYHVDETLIGGMVIRIGDRVLDSSIRTKLYNLSRELREITV